jgi:hypothetical protein
MKHAVISFALLAAVAASPGISHAQEQRNMIVRTAAPVSARVQFSEKCARQCEASPRGYDAPRILWVQEQMFHAVRQARVKAGA